MLSSHASFSTADVLRARGSGHSKWLDRMRSNLYQPGHMPTLIGDNETRMIVSYMVEYEPFMFDLVWAVLSSECRRRGSGDSPGVFVDSGANEGMWSLMGSLYGCHVISVEPQPFCQRRLLQSMPLNPFRTGRIDLWNHFLSTDKGATLMVPNTTCKGDAQFSSVSLSSHGSHDGWFSDEPTPPMVPIRAKRLDSSFHLRSDPRPSIVLWHLDVEGAELIALRSAAELLARMQVERIVFEMTPQLWERYNITLQSGFEELGSIFAGWECTYACMDNIRVVWSQGPSHYARYGRYGIGGGGKCSMPWNQRAPAVDVYCVHPRAPKLNCTRTQTRMLW